MEAAIVSHAEGSVGAVLGKLGSLLAQESLKLWGVRDEIQELKDELESMNAFLENLARKEDHDKQVKTWMKQVREMAYDTEDCIDGFMHRVGGPIEGGFFLRNLHKGVRLLRTLKARHEIASTVQSLKTRVHSVSERHARYAHIVPAPIESSGSIGLSIDPRFPTLFPKEGEAVGIEDRIEMVVELLMDNNVPDLRVISIVGYGGLGKTTLAMTAYESPRVTSGHFQCRAQISVSQKFNLNVLLRDIIKQVFQSESRMTESINEHQLVSKLKDYLNDKRYVIVIDDIWTESAWDSIKFVFPNNNKGSRIIVTTRIKSVAESCSFPYRDYVYEIKCLGKLESENLFYTKLFGHSNGCPPEHKLELKEISEDILKKCGGMPLAIVSIAGLLYVKPNKTKLEWQKVYKSLGSELEGNPSLEGMRKILNLSYNDLPYHLKTCFLYMSIFPEDHKIRRGRLVKRWVAEGFVSAKRGLSEQQVAGDYFDEFVNRNLFQTVEFSISGRIKTCRVHDMILELLVSKSIENNFVSLIEDQYTIVTRDKIRRLAVHSSEQNFRNIGLCHARSLSLFIGRIKSFSLSSFGALRVLDLENCGIKNNHLNSLGNLFLLKYLSLRNNMDVTKLPAQIKKLKHMETLDIMHTLIQKMPKGVFKLKNLKHLIVNFCEVSSLKLGNMRNLEILSFVSLKKGISKSLQNLKFLRKLGLQVPENSKEELLNIKLNQNLYRLSLVQYGGNLPKCIDSLQYLVKLKLSYLILTDMDMQKMGSLPRLLSLKLYNIQPQERKIFFRGKLFPKLKLLVIAYPKVCGGLVFEEATTGNLEQLQLFSYNFEQNKQEEEEFIIGIHHLLKLKEVQVGPESLMDPVKASVDAHPDHANIIVQKYY